MSSASAAPASLSENTDACPKCGTTEVSVFCSTTEKLSRGMYFKDDQGKMHVHDACNSTTTKFFCMNTSCKHQWVEYLKHTCWCGWVQGTKKNPDVSNGYNGPRIEVDRNGKPLDAKTQSPRSNDDDDDD